MLPDGLTIERSVTSTPVTFALVGELDIDAVGNVERRHRRSRVLATNAWSTGPSPSPVPSSAPTSTLHPVRPHQAVESCPGPAARAAAGARLAPRPCGRHPGHAGAVTPPDFTITSTDTGRDIELAVTGELDILTTPHLVVAVEGTVGQHRDVVIDLADVTFIDSTAIQALVRGQRTLAANRQRLRLVNPATVVTRVLDLTGLAHHFAIDGRPAGTATADASAGERTLQVMLQELAQRLLTEQSLGGDLERLIRFTCTAIPACDAASIALLIDGQPSTVAVTEHVALELDIAQYDNDEGPCLDALQGHPIRVDLLDRDERFNHFAQGAASQAVNSVLSIPINHRDDIVGTLNLYARATHGVRRRRHRRRPDRSHPSRQRHRPLRHRRRRSPTPRPAPSGLRRSDPDRPCPRRHHRHRTMQCRTGPTPPHQRRQHHRHVTHRDRATDPPRRPHPTAAHRPVTRQGLACVFGPTSAGSKRNVARAAAQLRPLAARASVDGGGSEDRLEHHHRGADDARPRRRAG